MYKIEQDGPQARLAYSLQCRANIYSMQFTMFSAKCITPYGDIHGALAFDVDWEAQDSTLNDKKLTIPVRFEIRVSYEQNVAVLVYCVIRADYDLAPDYQAASEEIEAFRASNAIFNCYPYFREFAQNSLSRMNYPPLAIPFLRLVPKPVQAANATVIEHHKAIPESATGKRRTKRLAPSQADAINSGEPKDKT